MLGISSHSLSRLVVITSALQGALLRAVCCFKGSPGKQGTSVPGPVICLTLFASFYLNADTFLVLLCESCCVTPNSQSTRCCRFSSCCVRAAVARVQRQTSRLLPSLLPLPTLGLESNHSNSCHQVLIKFDKSQPSGGCTNSTGCPPDGESAKNT